MRMTSVDATIVPGKLLEQPRRNEERKRLSGSGQLVIIEVITAPQNHERFAVMCPPCIKEKKKENQYWSKGLASSSKINRKMIVLGVAKYVVFKAR